MPLHPTLQAMCDAANEAAAAAADAPPPTDAERLDAVRAGAEAFGSLGAGEPEPMHSVGDHLADGPHGPIPVRVYRPTAAEGAALVVYFHGGGFVSGSVDAWDGTCRRLAQATDAVVVSVDYRLAPEHRFPIPLDDCHAAVVWAVEHADAFGADGGRLAVAGDSAGGNLAAAVALRSRVEGPPLRAQALIYPVVDPACATPSMVENATGYLLTTDSMQAMWGWYLGPGGDANDAFAAVGKAADYTDLPPAVVITAEYDPLRDEGEHYASLLDGFGVEVECTRYDGMLHGFFGLRELVPDSDRAVAQVAAFLRARL
ncbi:MAG: alpha/beta hydrolase [Actinobacteria bacterium]|nr:alpha/beta hydrolase [Actinomycetota bacterium]